MTATPGRRGLRRAVSRWANISEQETRDLRSDHGTEDGVTIEEAPDRRPVLLRGTLQTVTLRPRGGVPALEAELADGSGKLVLIWLGRRRIAGIAPGRALQVSGRIGHYDGARVMFNPRYELKS